MGAPVSGRIVRRCPALHDCRGLYDPIRTLYTAEHSLYTYSFQSAKKLQTKTGKKKTKTLVPLSGQDTGMGCFFSRICNHTSRPDVTRSVASDSILPVAKLAELYTIVTV